MKPHIINFKCSRDEALTIGAIVKRAMKMAPGIDALTMNMDITAAHCNGCPIDLLALLAAPDSDFVHDVGGISRHIDRKTGELGDCFVPRFALPPGAAV